MFYSHKVGGNSDREVVQLVDYMTSEVQLIVGRIEPIL